MAPFVSPKMGSSNKEGYWADIAIFNKDEIKDKATFENPHQYPEGIYYVIVNGNIAVDHGKITGLKSGKILKRQAIKKNKN